MIFRFLIPKGDLAIYYLLQNKMIIIVPHACREETSCRDLWKVTGGFWGVVVFSSLSADRFGFGSQSFSIRVFTIFTSAIFAATLHSLKAFSSRTVIRTKAFLRFFIGSSTTSKRCFTDYLLCSTLAAHHLRDNCNIHDVYIVRSNFSRFSFRLKRRVC